MKKVLYGSLIPGIMLLALGCQEGANSEPKPLQKIDAKPGQLQSIQAKQSGGVNGTGTVLSVTEAGIYVYMEIETEGAGKKWLAASSVKAAIGDKVEYRDGSVMTDFHSRTLEKDFDEIIFVNTLIVNGVEAVPQPPAGGGGEPHISGSAPAGHGIDPGAMTHGSSAKKVTVEKGSVQKLEGGYTVEELYAGKDELKGQTIKVRGRVVKAMGGIMGKNWLHLQDGTGEKGTHDLTVTSMEMAEVGNLVVATGKISVDQDLGHGYVYELVLEEATFAKEPCCSDK